MMQTIQFKFPLLILLVLPMLLSAGDGKLKGKYTKEKTIKKEYDVNSDALLKVNNSYGNLNLTSWDENRVVIEVHIKTNGNNEEKVQKKLDGISVDFEGSSSMVSARTIFNDNKSSWGWSRIDFMQSGIINADYSGFTIGKAGDLNIKADYTNSTVEKMSNLDYNTDYGKIEIGEADNVQGTGDYITVKLGTIHGDVDVSADYGSVKISKMASDAGDLQIRSDYTGVKVGYDPEYHFNFEIKTSYAGVSGKDDFEMNISEVKNTSKYYKGHYGSSNSGNSVYITSDYGGITFYKN